MPSRLGPRVRRGVLRVVLQWLAAQLGEAVQLQTQHARHVPPCAAGEWIYSVAGLGGVYDVRLLCKKAGFPGRRRLAAPLGCEWRALHAASALRAAPAWPPWLSGFIRARPTGTGNRRPTPLLPPAVQNVPMKPDCGWSCVNKGATWSAVSAGPLAGGGQALLCALQRDNYFYYVRVHPQLQLQLCACAPVLQGVRRPCRRDPKLCPLLHPHTPYTHAFNHACCLYPTPHAQGTFAKGDCAVNAWAYGQVPGTETVAEDYKCGCTTAATSLAWRESTTCASDPVAAATLPAVCRISRSGGADSRVGWFGTQSPSCYVPQTPWGAGGSFISNITGVAGRYSMQLLCKPGEWRRSRERAGGCVQRHGMAALPPPPLSAAPASLCALPPAAAPDYRKCVSVVADNRFGLVKVAQSLVGSPIAYTAASPARWSGIAGGVCPPGAPPSADQASLITW